MSSVVDICNLALSHLGDAATVSSIAPPEGSAQAEHCAKFYPIARDEVLERHAWSFATRRAALGLLTEPPPDNWLYVYAMPNECISVLGVFPPGSAEDAKSDDFAIEMLEDGTQVIYSNTETASARFVSRVSDTTKFSPLFVTALSYRLASLLAGPVLKGETGMQVSQGMFKWFISVLGSATASDANARGITVTHTPGWISGR